MLGKLMGRGFVAFGLLSLVATGCDDKAEKSDEDGEGKPSADEDEAAPKKKKKSDKEDEDEGHAKLKLEDTDWSVDRARARIKEGTLTITASNFEMVDGKSRREALRLVIQDYKGPGSYVTKGYDSNFSGVGFNSKKLEEAEKAGDKKKADAEATKEATKALKGASISVMKDAKIEITAADDGFIDGTVEWKGIVALKGPKSISGEFHARIRKKKPK